MIEKAIWGALLVVATATIIELGRGRRRHSASVLAVLATLRANGERFTHKLRSQAPSAVLSIPRRSDDTAAAWDRTNARVGAVVPDSAAPTRGPRRGTR